MQFSSQADDYDPHLFTSDCFFNYGEIFTAPVEEGDIKQVTDGGARGSRGELLT